MITAGEVLKRKRESLEKSLDFVSSETKIQKRFLEYIEADEYGKFDSEIFASGFIKIYSQYLGLDVDKLLALYRRSRPEGIRKIIKETPTKKRTHKRRLIHITPKAIAILTLTIFLLGALAYIAYQIYQFQKPPYLEISQPQDGITTQQNLIKIEGSTDITATLEINGNPVKQESTGLFSYELKLNEGLNTINIKSKKEGNSSLESNKTVRVTLEKEDQQPIIEEAPKEFTLKLQIVDSSSWIKLDVDSENKISQILAPGTVQEYKFTQAFTITSGKVLSTKISVNGEDINLLSNQSSGVSTISCKIEDSILNCD
jgi:cytoskeletal protein RodZ